MKTTNKIVFQVTIQSGKRRELEVSAYSRTDKSIYFKNGKYTEADDLSDFIAKTIKEELTKKLN